MYHSRQMKTPLWFITLIRKAFPARFFLSRMTKKFTLFGKFIDHLLFRNDHITYLPNPRTIQLHANVEKPEQIIMPTSAIEHFVEKAGSLFIMNTCICREADSCEDHPIDLGCLFMGEAVKEINPKLGRIVSKDEASAHLRRAEAEGLIFLIARNHIDTLWTGAKPGHRLLTVCFCCSCCCLWKTLPHIADEIGNKVTKLSGVTLEVLDTCLGCGACTKEICFADAISLRDGKAVIHDTCRGCGRCAAICPENAIRLNLTGDGEVARLINHLESIVEVT
jgi:ferredoxin